ncbi:hypothetical protein M5D96_000264, partial [Drosophila gunungcola]
PFPFHHCLRILSAQASTLRIRNVVYFACVVACAWYLENTYRGAYSVGMSPGLTVNCLSAVGCRRTLSVCTLQQL